ncbi:hypothetical protein [uncultured Legionella sp.]|uniref:hypothetical protein n=1 Tax=uncultured Legionella sp. TaxID=210934 RepID=UPI00262AC078|nr:hypothetical protein [uncultured Legionella sp.]
MAGNSFFDRAPAINTSKQATSEHTFIKVGGQQFRAVAVAFIDHFKSATRVNDASIKKILERFYTHFPKFISHQAYLTPMERMGILINSARKSEVVDCLAYVLHQITIDEVYAQPLKYREVFDGLDAKTEKMLLRQPGTELPASVLRALSQVLGVTITLSFTERGKDLRLREVYTSSVPQTAKIELVLQVNDGKYFPRVKNEGDYVYVGQLAVKAPEPVVNIGQNTGTVAEYIELIAEDNKQLLRTYNQWRQNFLNMVKIDELSTESLITLYIKFLPEKSTIIPDTKLFFSKLTDPDGKLLPVKDMNNSRYVIEELAGTLAEWISINQVNPDNLLDYIEKPALQTAISVA